MKIFKDEKCYVPFKELARHSMPNDLEFDKDKYKDNDYVIFSDSYSIDYVKSRVDIVDYDDVKDLSDKQLGNKIKYLEKKLNGYLLKCLDAPRAYKVETLKSKTFNTYLDVYYDLVEYKNNKEDIDQKIVDLTSSKTLSIGRM